MNLAVGFFDGVHLGHQRILSDADAVLTFRNHPTTVFAPHRSPALLMTLNNRIKLLNFLINNKKTGTVPHCEMTGTVPHCEKTGTVPHLEKTGTVPHLEKTGTVPHCEMTGTVPHCEMTGTVPHCEMTGTVPHCEMTGTVPHLEKTGTVPHCEMTGTVPNSGVRALEFTRELAEQSAGDFADWLRAEYPDLETVFCGDNWTFGAKAVGNAEFLRKRGFKVEVVPYAEFEGKEISSTRIRGAIAKGEMDIASQMLGRPWQVEGIVESGKGLGRTIAVPTINLRLDETLVRPPLGVYEVETRFGKAIANYGIAPTMGENAWGAPKLEVHVLNDEIAVKPGENVTVAFRRFIREEKRFASLDELKSQIADDIAKISK